jgi:hypothetical protein
MKRNIIKLGLAVLGWAFLQSTQPVHADTILYQTGFEASEGFSTNLLLGGQGGWLNNWDNGNGIVSGYIAGQGQHAYLGYNSPISTNQYGVSVWHPLNVTNFAPNQPIRVSALMEIVDSSNKRYDWFYWTVYNTPEFPLLSLALDNSSYGIWYQAGTNAWVLTLWLIHEVARALE